MQTVAQLTPIGIAAGTTVLMFVAVPAWVFYTTLLIVLSTCCAICVQIIINCDKRNKRLDALTKRIVGRANGNDKPHQ